MLTSNSFKHACALFMTTLALASIVGCTEAPEESTSATEDAFSFGKPAVSFCKLLLQTDRAEFSQYASKGACRDKCLSGVCVTTAVRDSIWRDWDQKEEAARRTQREYDEESGASADDKPKGPRHCIQDSECSSIEYCIDGLCQL